MVEIICLDEKLLEENTSRIRKELSRPHYDLFSFIQSKDSRKDLNSRETSIVCDSIEQLFSTQKTIYETLSRNKELDNKGFLQTYSYLLSAEKALVSIKNEKSTNKHFRESSLNFNNGETTFQNEIIEQYKKNISKSSDNEKDVTAITKGFFEWIKENAKQQYESEKYNQYSNLTNNIHIKVNGISLSSNGIISNQTGNINFNSDANKEQVVGNKELTSQIENSLKIFFLYDAKNKIHPHTSRYGHYIQRILAIGEPGCGKSFTLEAMINEANQLSSLYKKPLLIKDISNDLKSKYYSESSHNISKLFQEIEEGTNLHIIIADDLDTVIFGRKENEQSENISVFGEFIRNIESVKSNNKGNYLLLGTTNKPDSMDDALLRRFQKKIFVKGPETIEDYTKLMRIKFRGYIEDGLVNVSDWNKIGEQLYQNKFSGSMVADLASSLSEKITNNSIAPEFYKLDYKEITHKFSEIYKPITEKEVFEQINLFCNT